VNRVKMVIAATGRHKPGDLVHSPGVSHLGCISRLPACSRLDAPCRGRPQPFLPYL